MSGVFISYAREDEEVAKRLYQDLEGLGADPWLDKKKLFGGQGWRGAIKQAIRGSSHFIAVISRNSVQKRGYVQGEIHEALEMLKEIPPDEIYLIPVRLDATVPSHEQLRDLHYVDLFPSYAEGLEQIRKALEASGGIDSSKSGASAVTVRDAERIRSYRELFDRAAFRMPCIFESVLLEVQAAVQNVSAAMATGKLYSRDGNFLMEVPRTSAFETAEYTATLEDIRDSLSALRQTLATLLNLLCDAAGVEPKDFQKDFHHMEFFLERLTQRGMSPKLVMDALELMDHVDSDRNAILKKLNALLQKSQSKMLSYITLSSVQLRRSAELEINEGEGPQRWDYYYLRTHRKLTKFLAQTDSDTPAPTHPTG